MEIIGYQLVFTEMFPKLTATLTRNGLLASLFNTIISKRRILTINGLLNTKTDVIETYEWIFIYIAII